ncbi:murein hydrolase activator EnvC family protein [Halarcobacter ebronensis]|uniref:Peptidase M23 n=1 Tax=Halarcobacter ebronensis TaxID=1462615 RepID=A0A4Q1AN97_9BACT|nr:peptidoglycan DD-metalloendopeptidase family protein [Halarcobacter ebronensis]QKF81665.1 zinc metallopeptidase, M23 family [Halarcobacter ebronensis]RXK05589.1 peptidase M23 [Halarcobacter ebronensis]
MTRFFYIFIILITFLDASSKNIDKKIEENQEILKESQNNQYKADLQIKILASEISKQNGELTQLEKDISVVNDDIKNHESKLDEAKKSLSALQEDSKSIMQKKEENEQQIIKVIIDDFSSSIALKLAGESTLQELIDSEIYSLLSQNSKDEILKLNNNYELLTQNKKENQKKINEISAYIEKRKERKDQLSLLKKKYSRSLVLLDKRHKDYQAELKKSVQKQESLKDLLGKLNILKKEELEKEKRISREKAQRLAQLKKRNVKDKKEKDYSVNDVRNERYANDIDVDVRMIGSSTSGIEITKYSGRKTIAPLDSFTVVKKFGKYFDPVYKIELFNESIVLKTEKPEAKVKSIFNGKIVYAKKDAGMLENVVIIAHKDGLHTIYSHLDQISPSLKVGRWVKKGYVVGRVNDTLTFQATKNEKHVNPQDLFKI